MDWWSTTIHFVWFYRYHVQSIYQSALHASAKSTLVIYKLVLGSYDGGGGSDDTGTGGFLRLLSYIGNGGSGRR